MPSLGGNDALNPADSSGTSLWGGASLAGAIKPDTASFFLQAGFESLATPTPFPWNDPDGSLRDAVQVAAASHGSDLSGSVQPAVRTWKGGAGLGRMDWQVGRGSRVMFRAGGGAFQEKNPELGRDVGNHAGASLSGRDVSAAVALTTISKFANELRIGLALARRDWKGAGLPETRLVGEGIRVGGDASLPGLFESQLISLSDAVQYESGVHFIKAGLSAEVTSYKQQYDYGAAGRFLFGDLDRFGSGSGAYFRTAATSSEVSITAAQVGAFVQDLWRVASGFDLLLGLRYETQVLPANKITTEQRVDKPGREFQTIIPPTTAGASSPGSASCWTPVPAASGRSREVSGCTPPGSIPRCSPRRCTTRGPM